MAYIANVPLRFGDRIIPPGEMVPFESGRNYAKMLALGQIRVTADDPPSRRDAATAARRGARGGRGQRDAQAIADSEQFTDDDGDLPDAA